MKLPTMNFSVPASLCLCLFSISCTTQLPPITTTEIIRVPEYHLIEIPKDKLPQCDSLNAIALDIQWQDLPKALIDVLQTLDKCDAQISAFWLWYDSQEIALPE